MSVSSYMNQANKHLMDLMFYGKVDTAEMDEDIFGRWFILTFGETPILGERLQEPGFNGLAYRYGN